MYAKITSVLLMEQNVESSMVIIPAYAKRDILSKTINALVCNLEFIICSKVYGN